MATRINRLAQPKPNRLRYRDRRSVYWLDELPSERSTTSPHIESTTRWSDLSKCKTYHPQIGRSPTWEVSQWALKAVPSDRLCSLAQPRRPAAGWQHERLLLVPLSRGTQSAVASARICQLAEPRKKHVLEESSPSSRSEPMTRLSSKANSHIELLATPKHQHPMFKEDRSVCWTVSKTARNHVASQRLLHLSTPRERKALFEGYDPYRVSLASRSARPSPRIQQLSLPLPRKCICQQDE
ncbi:sperm microtubule associated protein 2 [Gouania willdenowi]|uniref:Testicular haploid expressed gene protein-like n=1 Tax=Gouania willdenowi TaxID=441366 RepID=A0A8C5GFW1_GOUWI|nr:testicular haploid expressed gene protein [Gouania willdenowi]